MYVFITFLILVPPLVLCEGENNEPDILFSLQDGTIAEEVQRLDKRMHLIEKYVQASHIELKTMRESIQNLTTLVYNNAINTHSQMMNLSHNVMEISNQQIKVRKDHNADITSVSNRISKIDNLAKTVSEKVKKLEHMKQVNVSRDILELHNMLFLPKEKTISFTRRNFGEENGTLYVSGLVEVWMVDKWLTLCACFFKDLVANVVCKTGGYQGGVYENGKHNEWLAKEGKTMWEKIIYCRGGEHKLSDCTAKNYDECSSFYPAAGVKCYIP